MISQLKLSLQNGGRPIVVHLPVVYKMNSSDFFIELNQWVARV